MPQRADAFDLARLRITAGEARRLDLEVAVPGFAFGGEAYAVADASGAEALPGRLPVRLDVSRMTGGGYALRLRLRASLSGPCQRCLAAAAPVYDVDAREIDQPGGGEELSSPYVDGGVLDLDGWARDALALALPVQILCREDCAGLCATCGEDLNEAGPEHAHEREPDPRWAALRALKLE